MISEFKVLGCDAAAPSVHIIKEIDGEPVYGCRCMVCGRCEKHTGNSNQGHYWSYCKVTQELEEFHFCCPDNCELEKKR